MAPGAEAAPAPAAVDQVRAIPVGDLSLSRPTSLAFSARDGALLIGQSARGRTTVRRYAIATERRLRSLRLPRLARPSTLTFNPGAQRLLAVGPESLLTAAAGPRTAGRAGARRIGGRSLRLEDPRGAALSADGRTLFILDAGGASIVRVPIVGRRLGRPARVALEGTAGRRLSGLALNAADGLFYVLAGRGTLLGFDASGALRRTADLRSLRLASPQALVFAPSADPTDHPATLRLYIADRGRKPARGRIVEASITSPAVASRLTPTQVVGTMVQLIHTSAYSPASPDPAGVTYIPARDRLLISDSEVNEMASFAGSNLFTATRTGSGIGTGYTKAYSSEPTGVAYNPADTTLFVSDDDGDRISVVLPGADGVHGTTDDIWSRFGTAAFGSTDAEGVEYDTATGRLWVCDGVGTEIYSIAPVNGVFGDGDDAVSHFDIAAFGARDCEGVGIDPQRDTLLAIDPSTKKIYESTKAGALVRVIDLSGFTTANKAYAGITMAPTSNPSDDPSATSYWVVDRAVDNGTDPNENDGRLYEVAVQTADALPSVTLTQPAAGATVSGTTALSADASDDNGVARVQFLVDDAVVGTDTTGADGWSVSWDSMTVGDGSHTVTAIAEDTAGQTRSASHAITVANAQPDTTAPAVSISAPAAGATVSGTTAVAANATDDVAVTSVSFLVDGAPLGTDVDGSNGWSAAWNTTSYVNGSHTITAVARDAAGNETASAAVAVNVANPDAPVLVNVPVRTGADDADETVGNGAVRRTNGDIELGHEQTGLTTLAGLRFAGVPVPAGADIVSAHVVFTADEKGRKAAELTVAGEAADSSQPFTSSAFNLSARARTSASVSWTPPKWLITGAAEPTPDLGTVVTQIVARPGWAYSNALTILVQGSGRRTAESFEGGAPAVLRVEYTP